MQRMQTLSLLKTAGTTLSLSKNVTLRCATFTQHSVPKLLNNNKQMIHTTPVICAEKKSILSSDSYISRSIDFLRYHAFKKYKYRAKGYFLYRYAIDTIDHISFIEDYRMPDTFYSWFLVTELHVWMLMVRLMDAGRDGLDLRRNLVDAMWNDVHIRKKKLGGVSESTVKKHMEEIGFQFNAAVLSYDEGLLTNDQVLAAAVWRRLLQSECNNPEQLERLVHYIRKTMNMLDRLPHERLFDAKTIEWLDHKKC